VAILHTLDRIIEAGMIKGNTPGITDRHA
jgi:hypothetical protein